MLSMFECPSIILYRIVEHFIMIFFLSLEPRKSGSTCLQEMSHWMPVWVQKVGYKTVQTTINRSIIAPGVRRPICIQFDRPHGVATRCQSSDRETELSDAAGQRQPDRLRVELII